VVAEDFLQDALVRQWLDGVEPAWTLLTFDSLRALRQEPSASQTAIRIGNNLSTDAIRRLSGGAQHSDPAAADDRARWPSVDRIRQPVAGHSRRDAQTHRMAAL
jgi:hypothetical protein